MVTSLRKIGLSKRVLFFGIVLATTISSSIIFFADLEEKEHYSHWVISISTAAAALIAFMIVYRQKHHHGLIERADLALASALFLLLSAAVLWAIYESLLELVPPVPSIADVLAIAGYASLAFYVFSTYLRYHKQFHFSNRLLVAASGASAIFLFVIIMYTVSLVDLSTYNGVATFSVVVAYPAIDAIIIVPSFLILVNYKKEPQWFTPWFCKSAGIFLMAIADGWFALFIVTSWTTELWPSAIVFAAHNVIIAAGLLWYAVYLVSQYSPKSGQGNDKVVQASSRPSSPSSPTSSSPPMLPIPSRHDSRTDRSASVKKPSLNNLVFALIAGALLLSVVLIVGNLLSPYSSLFPSVLLFGHFPFFGDISDPFLGGISDTSGEQVSVGLSNSSDTVKFGAVLPTSGVSSSSGKPVRVALEIALDEINTKFSKSDSNLRYELAVYDTESDPATGLEKLKLLSEQDVKIVVGPSTSAELEIMKDFADKNNIILFSPSSTAPSLAIEDDNIFRLVPDDSHQAKAISKKMWEHGIRFVIPLWRDDVYGRELMQAVRTNFQGLGGGFDENAENLGYVPRTGHLATSLHRINFIMWDNVLKVLESQVERAISQHGIDKVGVYMVSLDEVIPILIQAHNHPILSKVRWYGSDGSTLNGALLRNHESAIFASNTSFYGPTPNLDGDKGGFHNHSNSNSNNKTYGDLMNMIGEEVHTDPSPYSAAAYDVIWIAAMAENATRFDSRSNGFNVTESQTIENLKDAIMETARSYPGITGNTTLNRMGDRIDGDYDFWKVMAVNPRVGNDEFAWVNCNISLC